MFRQQGRKLPKNHFVKLNLSTEMFSRYILNEI
jgi:hypothetical protein